MAHSTAWRGWRGLCGWAVGGEGRSWDAPGAQADEKAGGGRRTQAWLIARRSPNGHNSAPTPPDPGFPMFSSLQTIFGHGKQFYALFNEAADAAYDSTRPCTP